MRSPFAEWLDQMQKIADQENIIVQARHIDVLDHYYNFEKLSPLEAFNDYKPFLKRWNALTENGKYTEAT